MHQRYLHLLVVVLLTPLAACLKSGSSTCGDLVCPADTTCMGTVCVDSDLVAACTDHSDGSTCNVAGLPTSKCSQGICQASRCGDGRVTGTEKCDGTDVHGHTCQTEGFYTGSAVTCSSDCQLITSQCSGQCGDGIKNGPELCDGADLGSASCFDVGYYAHDGLKCTDKCTFDASGCTGGHCGDKIVNGLEECDGADLGSANGSGCAALGFKGSLSRLACTSACTYSASSCLCTSGRCQVGQTCQCSKTGCDCK